jgi:hypothetical protein
LIYILGSEINSKELMDRSTEYKIVPNFTKLYYAKEKPQNNRET